MTAPQDAFERLKTLVTKLDSIELSWLDNGQLLAWKEATRSALRGMCPEDNERERRLNMLEEIYFFPAMIQPSHQQEIQALRRGAEEAKAILNAAMEEFNIYNTTPSSTIGGTASRATPLEREIFIVHGHDDGMKETVARFLEKSDFTPIILHEKANAGDTLIEKFERHSGVGYAVVLFSPDDFGAANGAPSKPRARQNVVFELGFFMGKLGRDRVCVLIKEGVEKPSDIDGIV